jgi:hypothetical protein
MPGPKPNFRLLFVVAIILVLAVVGYSILTMPDRRSASEKIGAAIHDLPLGMDKAARQLEDRTPGQKIGDAIRDAGDQVGTAVKENTAAQP